jgi:hypothetical protein
MPTKAPSTPAAIAAVFVVFSGKALSEASVECDERAGSDFAGVDTSILVAASRVFVSVAVLDDHGEEDTEVEIF